MTYDPHPYDKTRETFTRDVAEHKMHVMHVDGLYKHLRFRRDDTRAYWFDIVTWPGNLVISGDMGTYAFQRESDMLSWFAFGVGINPSYWGEKVTAGEVREYSADLARAEVTSTFIDWLYDENPSFDADTARTAWNLLHTMLEDACDDEIDLREALEQFDRSMPGRFKPFEGPWETPFQDFTWHFLWCCWAIRHAVTAYRALPAETTEVTK